MPDIDSVTTQVKHNCNISDAVYWGYYSPCGLLLRLRDLYKIEHALKPWEGINHEKIGAWIEDREEMWQDMESLDFQEIEINGKRYNPFEIKEINRALSGDSIVYSAGYGHMLKPVFILAELSEQVIKGKYKICRVNRELARDLSTSPAMIQGNTIIARQETTQMFLWGKFEEMKSRKCSGSLYHAFSEYGISRDIEGKSIEDDFSRIVRGELSAYIYHELGEASQRRILGRWWRQLLVNIPYSRAELFIRALKDILSDTCRSGMLSYIVDNKKTGSLSFYLSLLSGYRKSIFPDMAPAYAEFMETGDWGIIGKARDEGYKKAGNHVRKLKEMFDKGRVSADMIEQEFLSV